jgi:hypothetical protein
MPGALEYYLLFSADRPTHPRREWIGIPIINSRGLKFNLLNRLSTSNLSTLHTPGKFEQLGNLSNYELVFGRATVGLAFVGRAN